MLDVGFWMLAVAGLSIVAGKGFRDLRVWQSGMDLVEEVYRLTKQFPKEELYGLSNQVCRAAVSIPSNIAEGQARSHAREYLQFLAVAQGSLAEVQTQIEIAGRLKYLPGDEIRRLLERAASVAKQLYALRNTLADGK